MARLVASGVTHNEISERIGLSVTTICRRLAALDAARGTSDPAGPDTEGA